MAFMKYARAAIVHPQVTGQDWARVRTAAKAEADVSENLVARASEIFGKPFNPKDYLLTHCFPAGHMVLMADGTEKPIEQVVVGDEVVTHAGNIHPVTQVMRREVDEDLVTVKSTSLDEVACTGEHPFYVIRDQDGAVPQWVGARDLREGDRTYTPTLHETAVPDAVPVVSEIEHIGRRHFRGTVYNLSVEGDESYLVNRQAVHNCTIVASVDIYEPSGMKLGKVLENGFRVNRKYPKFRVFPRCNKYINNNLDFWPREVLLQTYKSFIGGHSFIEHVQVEDLSKGRIIDAVARDLSDTVYVDILIANERKHTELCQAIESGEMSTLSMGCTVTGTQCTKCGHWAADETELCSHIRYEKGNTFFDEQGQFHRIAEKCGDESEPDSVQFVEASWVGTPAFTGAVLRNIIEVSPDSAIAKKAAAILAQPPEEWSPATYRKAASLATTFMAGWGDEGGNEGGDGEGGDAPAAPAGPAKGPFDDLEQELMDHLKDRVRKKLKKDMDQADIEQALSLKTPSSTNEGIMKEGHLMMDDLVDSHRRAAYGSTLASMCRSTSNDADLMNRVALLNTEYGVSISVPMYRAALRLGTLGGYSSISQFVRACQAVLGKTPTIAEVKTLIRLGKLISRRGQDRRGKEPSLAVAKAKENVQ